MFYQLYYVSQNYDNSVLYNCNLNRLIDRTEPTTVYRCAESGANMEDSHNSNSSHNNSHSSSSDEIETEVEKKRKKLKTEKLNLTLDNFDGDDIPDDYPYVLTSPRSLAACKHFGVRVSDLKRIGTRKAVWPDLAIYWTLGKFLQPLATIILPKSPTFLGNFCKGVENYPFSSATFLGNFYRHLAIFFWFHWWWH